MTSDSSIFKLLFLDFRYVDVCSSLATYMCDKRFLKLSSVEETNNNFSSSRLLIIQLYLLYNSYYYNVINRYIVSVNNSTLSKLVFASGRNNFFRIFEISVSFGTFDTTRTCILFFQC